MHALHTLAWTVDTDGTLLRTFLTPDAVLAPMPTLLCTVSAALAPVDAPYTGIDFHTIKLYDVKFCSIQYRLSPQIQCQLR